MSRCLLLPLLATLAGCHRPCDATCAGCCDLVGECQLGTQAGECGLGGASCVICGAGQRCASGACSDVAPMDAGSAPCGVLNCLGCCDAQGQCRIDETPLACGELGVACFACEPGQLCEGSACALCDATNCQGCCSALSGCVSGSFQNGDLCGGGAGSCLVCDGPTVCIGGACTGAISPQAPGDPCASDTDCAALGAFAVCRLQTSTGVPYLGGFCTIECGADGGRCPLSSSCVSAAGVFGENEALCWPTCDLNCRSPGYTCYPLELQDGGTTAACWLDPNAPDGLEGAACGDDSTCLTAIGPGLGVCIPAVSDGGPTGFFGGMCTAACEISTTCGDGGICEGVAPPPTRPGEPFGFCAQACSTAWTGRGSCRSGYLCALGPTDVQPNGFCEPDCRNEPGLCQPGMPCSDAGYCCNGGFCLPMTL